MEINKKMHKGIQIDFDSDWWNAEYKEPTKSLEQEPRKGHWIDCECDKCGYEVQPWNTTNFCPNCGADMREVKE